MSESPRGSAAYELNDLSKHADAADVIDYGSLHESYKKVMGTALQTFLRLRATPITGWTLLRYEVAEFDPVTISKAATGEVRISGILSGPARRYAYAMRDYDRDTRLSWDNSTEAVKEHHAFHSGEGKLHYVECTTRHRAALRWSAGILFAYYDEGVDEHRVTFCSVDHPLFRCPAGATPLAADRWTLFAKDTCTQKDARRCEVTIIISQREGGIDEDLPEMMRSRLYALETAVTKWDLYYGPSRDPKKLENRK